MNLQTHLLLNLSILGWLVILFQGNPARAADCNSPTPIHFQHGDSAATVRGGIIRAEDVCYVLTAHAGQHLDANITSLEQNVAFSLYTPGYQVTPGSEGPDISGSTVPGAGDQDDATSLHARLSASGRYLFLLGTVRGGGAKYQLHVQVR